LHEILCFSYTSSSLFTYLSDCMFAVLDLELGLQLEMWLLYPGFVLNDLRLI